MDHSDFREIMPGFFSCIRGIIAIRANLGIFNSGSFPEPSTFHIVSRLARYPAATAIAKIVSTKAASSTQTFGRIIPEAGSGSLVHLSWLVFRIWNAAEKTSSNAKNFIYAHISMWMDEPNGTIC